MKVKIICGTVGYRNDTGLLHCIKAGDEIVDIPDETAKRLISRKVAVKADSEINTVATTVEDDSGYDHIETPVSASTPPDASSEAELFPRYDMEMKGAELKEIMTRFEIPFNDRMTKAQMIEALDNYFSRFKETELEDDDDTPPIPTAQEPE